MLGRGQGRGFQRRQFLLDLGGSYWLRMWKPQPPMAVGPAALLCLASFRGQLDIFSLGGMVKRKLGYPMLKLLSSKPCRLFNSPLSFLEINQEGQGWGEEGARWGCGRRSCWTLRPALVTCVRHTPVVCTGDSLPHPNQLFLLRHS